MCHLVYRVTCLYNVSYILERDTWTPKPLPVSTKTVASSFPLPIGKRWRRSDFAHGRRRAADHDDEAASGARTAAHSAVRETGRVSGGRAHRGTARGGKTGGRSYWTRRVWLAVSIMNRGGQ